MTSERMCTKCHENPITYKGNNNTWCAACQGEIQKRNRGATANNLRSRAINPRVYVFRPGDEGFTQRAAECTHISKIPIRSLAATSYE